MTAVEKDRAFRESVRVRFGRRCAACPVRDEDQKARTGRALSVHRVRPGSRYSIDGCVPLCQACHLRAHAAARRHKGIVLPVDADLKVVPLTLPGYGDLMDEREAARAVPRPRRKTLSFTVPVSVKRRLDALAAAISATLGPRLNRTDVFMAALTALEKIRDTP